MPESESESESEFEEAEAEAGADGLPSFSSTGISNRQPGASPFESARYVFGFKAGSGDSNVPSSSIAVS